MSNELHLDEVCYFDIWTAGTWNTFGGFFLFFPILFYLRSQLYWYLGRSLLFLNLYYFLFCFTLLLSIWCAVSISAAIICHLAVFDVSLIVCLLFYHVFGGQLKLFPVFTWVLGFSFWCSFCSVACFFIVARFQSSVKDCSNCLSLSLVSSISFILFSWFFFPTAEFLRRMMFLLLR